MAITASSITTSNTLEQLRAQFNNLVTDVSGLESGTVAYGALSATTTNTTTLNVEEDGTIIFEGATADGYETTLTVTDPTADRTITLPNETGTVLTDASSIDATTFTVSANNTANETVYPIFVDGATGSQGAETDTGLSYNPSTELLTVGKLLLDDGATIGVTSSTSAITIASTGIVTLVDDLLLKDAATIGNASVADVMTLAATGIVTFKDDILIKDGGTIGSASSTSAITVASDGDITLTADITIGALLKMPTNTGGYLLVGDGTSYEEVAVSGDVTMASGGAVTIAANAVEGSMLNTDTISGQTALTSGLESTDELLVSDAGTLKRMDVSVLATFTDGNATALAIALG